MVYGFPNPPLRKELLLYLTLLGVVLGILFGALLRLLSPTATALKVVGLPGNLFLRSLKMLVLPLVGGSIVGGVCSLRSTGTNMGAIARKTLLYYLGTTAVAVGVCVLACAPIVLCPPMLLAAVCSSSFVYTMVVR